MTHQQRNSNDSDPLEELNRRQVPALAALLEEPSVSAAAKACGVSLSTLNRWLRQPVFKAALRERREQILAHAVGRIQSTLGEAVDALRDCLSSDSDATRVRAATAILDHAYRGREALDVAERLNELEATLRQSQPAAFGVSRAG